MKARLEGGGRRRRGHGHRNRLCVALADGQPVTATSHLLGALPVTFNRAATGPATSLTGALTHSLGRIGINGTFLFDQVASNSAGVWGICNWDGAAPPEATTQPGCP